MSIKVEIDTTDGGVKFEVSTHPDLCDTAADQYRTAADVLEHIAGDLRAMAKPRSGRVRWCNNHAERGPHDCQLHEWAQR